MKKPLLCRLGLHGPEKPHAGSYYLACWVCSRCGAATTQHTVRPDQFDGEDR